MRAREERGVMSLYALWVILAFTLVTVVAVHLVVVMGLGQRAGQAADLAALAGSRASVAGEPGCAAARRTARDNGAMLVRCRMDADVATVTARVTVRFAAGRWAVSRRARAAPDFYLD